MLGIDPDEMIIPLAGVGANGDGWDGPTPILEDEEGSYHFSDYPDFQPTLSPATVLRLGSFGGGYFRPITSTVTGVLRASRTIVSQSKRRLLHIAVRPSPSPRHRVHPFRITTMSDKTSFDPIYVLACLPSCLPSCLHTCLPSVVRGGAVGGLETAETCRRSDRRSDRRSGRRSDRRTGHTSRTTTTATSAIVVTCIVIPATSTETGSGAGSPQVGSTLIAWWAMGTGWAGWG